MCLPQEQQDKGQEDWEEQDSEVEDTQLLPLLLLLLKLPNMVILNNQKSKLILKNLLTK